MRHTHLVIKLLLLGWILSSLATAGRAATTWVWAPGVINPTEGTVEMDVEFLRLRSEMLADWRFLLRARSNQADGATTVLGVVFCPPRDGRDFLGVVRTEHGTAGLSVPPPDFAAKSIHRVVLKWGQGSSELWMDGKRLSAQPSSGDLVQLPPQFSIGLEDYFAVKAARVSSVERPSKELAAVRPLTPDDHTTWSMEDTGPGTVRINDWQREEARSVLFIDRVSARFVATVGEPLPLPLRATNFTSSAADYTWSARLYDRSGQEVGLANDKLRIGAGTEYATVSIPLPAPAASGYHRAVITLTDPRGRSMEQEFAFVAHRTDEAPEGRLAGYLGHHHALTENPDAYRQLGIRWHRAWGIERSFLWHVVEPAPGEFHWQEADAAIATAEAHGLHTVGVLGYPPTWASTYSPAELERVKGNAVKGYNHHPERYQPRDIDEWRRYVRETATRYRGRVNHWEIGNEMDFHPPFLHASFSGSTKDYAEMLAVAYAEIKEVDPAAVVMPSGFSLMKGVTDADMPADLMELGAAAHFDAFAVHGYTERSTLNEVIGVVRAHKPGVPLWQTERELMDSPGDDYQAIYSLFWCLQRGFKHYFFHEADLDKGFGRLNPTPSYAVTSEVARQLRAADEFVGPVPGAPDNIGAWQLRRTDGRWLQVFAINNGRLMLHFSDLANDAAIEVTNLHGETLHRGPLTKGELVVEGLVYVLSPEPLSIARFKREAGNLVVNPGFEMREGDFIMDESAARPTGWLLNPKGTPVSAMRFVKGREGKFALAVGGPAAPKGAHLVQRVQLDEGGLWRLNAWIRVPKGTTVPLRFFLQVGDGRWPGRRDAKPVIGTGEWQQVSVEASAPAGGARAYVLIGVEWGTDSIEIDDVELMAAEPNSQPTSESH